MKRVAICLSLSLIAAVANAAGTLPNLGSQPAPAKGDPERCHQLQSNFDSGQKVTFPIGLGAGRIFNFGKLPVRISGEIQYSVIHPDDQISSRWNFRLSFIPVIPTFML